MEVKFFQLDPMGRFTEVMMLLRNDITIREALSKIALENSHKRPGVVFIPILDRDHMMSPVEKVCKEAYWLTDKQLCQRFGRNYEGRSDILNFEKLTWKGLMWQIKNQDLMKRGNIGGQFILFTGNAEIKTTLWNNCALHFPSRGFYEGSWLAKNHPELLTHGGVNLRGLEKLEETNKIFEEAARRYKDTSKESEKTIKIDGAKPYFCANPECGAVDFNKKGREAFRKMSSSFEKCTGKKPKSYHKKKNMKCAGCNKVYYCSRKCQKAHWKVHKKECKKTQKKATEAFGKMRVRDLKKEIVKLGGEVPENVIEKSELIELLNSLSI